jgi:hypothetical protein
VRFKAEDMGRIEKCAKATKQTISDVIRSSSVPDESRYAQVAELPDASLFVWDEGSAWSGLVVLKNVWEMTQFRASDEDRAKAESLRLAHHSKSRPNWRPVAFRREW